MFFVGPTSLTVHGDLNKILVATRHMFTPTDWLNWVNVEGGCCKIKDLFVWSSLTEHPFTVNPKPYAIFFKETVKGFALIILYYGLEPLEDIYIP